MQLSFHPTARSLMSHSAWMRVAFVGIGLALLWSAITWAVALP
jgi:hypothetical protein